MTALPQPEATATTEVHATFDREVRLGLVLYGGVSLAVYINGVAQEFFNAVKGRGVYSLVKSLTGSDIVVDIVSGTSAGGINGVLLSHCLANNHDFGAFAKLWKEHGDIQKLMNSIGVAEPQSLLDGEGYFQRQLEDALRTLPPYTSQRTIASRVEAIDLFVTSTDFYGDLSTRLDELGSVIEVKDHRRVFKLRYRAEEVHDFSAGPGASKDLVEQHRRALATISRSTATFPGAFAPVEVPADERKGEESPTQWHHFLHNWAGKKTGERMVLIDGGVIDNKPFSHTLRDIYSRTAQREVNRKLFFVEPDPEHFKSAPKEGVPDFFGVVSASLSGLPAYESIADDLRSIDDRNRLLANYEGLVGRVRERLRLEGRLAAPSEVQRELYLDSRLEDFGDRFVASVLGGERSHRVRADQLHRTSAELLRWFQTLEVAPPPAGGAGASVAAQGGAGGASTAGAASTPASGPSKTPAQVAAEKRTHRAALQAEFLERFDIDYRIRRLFHVSYYVYDLAYGRSEVPFTDEQRAAAANLLGALNRWIGALTCVQAEETELRARLWAHAGLGKLLDTASAQGIWRAVLPLVDGFFNPAVVAAWVAGLGKLPPPDASSTEWAQVLPDACLRRGEKTSLRSLLCAAVTNGVRLDTPPGKQPPTLLQHFDTEMEALMTHFAPALGEAGKTVDVAWKMFEVIDTTLFPFEFLASLREKDRIDVVRISPRDAQTGVCNRRPYDKVCGETLGHFGAFLKRSWRGNDILWGRLDTVTLLLQSLLQPGRIGEVVMSAEGRQKVRHELMECAGLRGAFDSALVLAKLFEDRDGPRDVVAAWLSDLLGEVETRRNSALEKKSFDPAVLQLTELCQARIVATDVAGVVSDAVMQSREWGTLPGSAKAERNGSFDALVGGFASALMTKWGKKDAELPELDQPLAFFKETYNVGAETPAADIPPLVLLRLVAQVALVMEGVLKASLKKSLPPVLATLLTPVTFAIRVVGYVAFAFAQTSQVARLSQLLVGLGAISVAVGYGCSQVASAQGATAGAVTRWIAGYFPAIVLAVFLLGVLLGFFYLRTVRQTVAWLAVAVGVGFVGVARNEGLYRRWETIVDSLKSHYASLSEWDWAVVAVPVVALVVFGLIRAVGFVPRRRPLTLANKRVKWLKWVKAPVRILGALKRVVRARWHREVAAEVAAELARQAKRSS